jgi:hypothetical protein
LAYYSDLSLEKTQFYTMYGVQEMEKSFQELGKSFENKYNPKTKPQQSQSQTTQQSSDYTGVLAVAGVVAVLAIL